MTKAAAAAAIEPGCCCSRSNQKTGQAACPRPAAAEDFDLLGQVRLTPALWQSFAKGVKLDSYTLRRSINLAIV